MFKGKVSTADNTARTARIIVLDMDGIITPEIPVAQNVGVLAVNDMVAIAVFSDCLADSLVVAKF